MKRNMVPLLGIAFVAAIVATGVVYGLFGGRLRAKAPELAGQSIVVASRDLERGTVIKPEDLQVSQVKGALKGSYSKVDDAVGATLLEAVQKNEPLLEGRVASLDPKGAGAGGGIAAGMRAVSIRVFESSGAMGLLHAAIGAAGLFGFTPEHAGTRRVDGYYQADCAQRYRSYNPATGYFMGHDGTRHRCR